VNRSGWLLFTVLLGGIAVLLLAPVWSCPDCAGAVAALRPEQRGAGSPDLGCPRCSDRGRVGGLGRWLRRGRDPELAALLRDSWSPRSSKAESDAPRIQALARRSGRTLPPGYLRIGPAVFVEDGSDSRLVVPYWQPSSPGSWDGVFLFGRGGELLDHVRFSGHGNSSSCRLEWGAAPGRELRVVLRSAAIAILVQRGTAPSTTLPPETLIVRFRNGKIDVASAGDDE
jgi:hypothetical protein